MGTYDRIGALFWLTLSVAVFTESLRIGIGSLGNPGMGFMACGTSVVMGILSLILFIQSSGRRRQEARVSPLRGLLLWRVALVVSTILLYILLLPTLGYLIDTALLMCCFLFLAGKRQWLLLIAFPGLTAVISFGVFSKLLNCNFPAGLLSF
jgi:hypothetical protein